MNDSRFHISALLAPSVLLATPALGQFTFSPVVNYTATQPSGVAAGDFDGDGDQDLAVTTDAPDKINLLINNGSGVYSAGPVILMPNSSSPNDIKAGDLDGDLDIDLAVVLRDFNQVIAVVNSRGAFSLGATVPIGADARGMTMADIEGDGDLDLAVANRDDDTATVLRNAGDATFSTQTPVAGAGSRGAAFGDFTGDGVQDLAVSNHDSRTISLFIGGATFSPTGTLSTGAQLRPEGLTAADFDGDGDVDLAVATNANGLEFASVYRNLGGGAFSAMTNFATGGIDASDIIATDLNCDDAMDLVVSNNTSNNLSLLLNLGPATFGAPSLVGVGTSPELPIGSDLDGDGDDDLAVANRDSNTVSVLINDTCTPKTAPGDVNGDSIVNVDDLLAVMNAWGACPGCPADINGDGLVNVDDLLIVINNWG